MTHSVHSSNYFSGALFVALIAALLLTSLSTTSVNASEQTGIRVSAIGKASVEPELARINLSFEHTAKTADLAQDFTSKQVSKLLNSLKEYNIDEKSLDSSQVNISPSYQYQDGTRTLEGYKVTRFVNFSLNNLNQLESLVNAITSAEVSRVNAIHFDVKDSSVAHSIALQNAIEKTKSAAKVIAQSYGAELGKVQFVEHAIEHMGGPKPSPMRAMALEADSASATDTYQIKNIEFTARVSTTFALD